MSSGNPRNKRKTHCKRGHLREGNTNSQRGCKTCAKESANTLYKTQPARHKKNCYDWIDRNKLEALTHYGPSGTLGCCWENCHIADIDMLSLDHVNNDGNKDRQKSGARQGGASLYCWAKKNGYPDTLQTLCFNHQCKKKMMKSRADRYKSVGE
jgi:hypothetical protein